MKILRKTIDDQYNETRVYAETNNAQLCQEIARGEKKGDFVVRHWRGTRSGRFPDYKTAKRHYDNIK